MNTYEQLLRDKHLSLTSVRLSLLEVIDENPHTDAHQIFHAIQTKIPGATIQAVYNNLNVLTKAGIIREIKPKGQAYLYELQNNDNHHHLVCRNCEQVVDTKCNGCAPCMSPTTDHGFVLDEAEVIFWGLCPKCQINKGVHHE